MGYDEGVSDAVEDLQFAATNITADVVNNRLQNFLRVTSSAVISLSGLLEFIPFPPSASCGHKTAILKSGNRYAVPDATSGPKMDHLPAKYRRRSTATKAASSVGKFH
jgi:hypothetical protein